jgi:hypothetical protein
VSQTEKQAPQKGEKQANDAEKRNTQRISFAYLARNPPPVTESSLMKVTSIDPERALKYAEGGAKGR